MVSSTSLVRSGWWQLPLVLPRNVTSRTAELSSTLSSVAERMAAGWTTDQSGQASGILFGTYSEWIPSMDWYGILEVPSFVSDDVEFSIITESDKIYLLSKDHASLERCVWRFLNLLGYRQLRPTPEWEVIPSHDDLELQVEIIHRETGTVRFVTGIGNGCGIMEDADDRLTTWKVRNCLDLPGGYSMGHTWSQIISHDPLLFSSNPHLSNEGYKLCVLEGQVKSTAVDWAKKYVKTRPEARLVPLTAADGLKGWEDPCERTAEERSHNPADRQIILANHVQEELGNDPETSHVRVSILAYGVTAVDPTDSIDPRIVVGITDGFYLGGNTYDTILEKFRSLGAVDVTPYSYLSVWTWDRNEPGASRVSSTSRVIELCDLVWNAPGSLKGLSSEGSCSWGPDGLGYWTLGRILSGERTSSTRDDVVKLRLDYLKSAYPTTTSTMTAYYDLIDGDTRTLLTSDLIHRMCLTLSDALLSSTDLSERTRILDDVMYARYVDLLRRFQTEQNAERFEDLLRWMFRTRSRDIVNFRCAYYDPTWRQWIDQLEAKYGYTLTPYSVSHNHPWPDVVPAEEELRTCLIDGISSNALFPFETVRYSDDLIRPSSPPQKARGTYVYMSSDSSWTLWSGDSDTFHFTAKSGMAYSNKGPGKISVVDPETYEVLSSVEVPPDKVERSYDLRVQKNSTVKVNFSSRPGLDVRWRPETSLTWSTTLSKSPFAAGFSGYFYVPSGCSVVAGYWSANGARLTDPSGRVVLTNTSGSSYFKVDSNVVPGYWKIDRANVTFALLTTPPQIALSPAEILLPREVVEADGI